MNMKSCRDFENLLSLLTGDELEVEQTARLAAHLERCAVCRQKVVAYKQMANHLAAMDAPALPEILFADFYAGVREKIATDVQVKSRMLGLAAVIYALHRRWRFALAAVAFLMMAVAAVLLTHRFWSTPQPSYTLARLLEDRNWEGLYHALQTSASRRVLLDEPVPAELLKSAIIELIEARDGNRKVREGLERILTQVTAQVGRHPRLGGSAQVLGKITAAGYEPVTSRHDMGWRSETVLQKFLQLGANGTVTIREMILRTS